MIRLGTRTLALLRVTCAAPLTPPELLERLSARELRVEITPRTMNNSLRVLEDMSLVRLAAQGGYVLTGYGEHYLDCAYQEGRS